MYIYIYIHITHYINLLCITLHYITLHYVVLCYIIFYYIMLYSIILYYFTWYYVMPYHVSTSACSEQRSRGRPPDLSKRSANFKYVLIIFKTCILNLGNGYGYLDICLTICTRSPATPCPPGFALDTRASRRANTWCIACARLWSAETWARCCSFSTLIRSVRFSFSVVCPCCVRSATRTMYVCFAFTATGFPHHTRLPLAARHMFWNGP